MNVHIVLVVYMGLLAARSSLCIDNISIDQLQDYLNLDQDSLRFYSEAKDRALSALPKIFALTSANISNALCKEQSDLFVKALENGSDWARLMFDSSSKIQSGIFSGNIIDLGSYDQCVSVTGPVRGQYCRVHIKIPTVEQDNVKTVVDQYSDKNQMEWSLCVPDTCTIYDVTVHMKSLLPKSSVFIKDYNCQSIRAEEELDVYDWLVIVFMCIYLALLSCATAYDHFMTEGKAGSKNKFVIALSFKNNFNKLTKITNHADVFYCINGLRVLTMLWIVLIHRYTRIMQLPLYNKMDSLKFLEYFGNMFIVGSQFGVDTFFAMGGIVGCYSVMKVVKSGKKFNIYLYYLHRYVRLTPLLVIMLIFTLTILYKSATGPLWPHYMYDLRANCQKNWWLLLLYVQNYFSPNDMCFFHSWYLNVDMQLFWISPLILLPLCKRPKFGLIMLWLLLVVSLAIPFVLVIIYDFNIITGGMDPEGYKILYVPAHTRASSWLIGVLCGYFLYETNNKTLELSKRFVAISWVTTVITLLVIVYGPYPLYQKEHVQTPLESAFYITFSKPLWSAGICWIVFACARGYGGSVNKFLSLPIFQIFSRLTYCLYIMHYFVEYVNAATQRSPFYYNLYNTLYLYCGDVVTSCLVAFLFYLVFEQPIANLSQLAINALSGEQRPARSNTVEIKTNGNNVELNDKSHRNNELS